MRPERLLQHFDTISDAPDAVAKLRRLVLDLAVRGKLVAQNPADTPFLPRPRSMPSAADGTGKDPSLDFALPHGWHSYLLGDVAECLDFMRRPVNGAERERRIAEKRPEELFPYFGATQQQGWIDDYLFDEELVLLGEDGVPFHDPLRTKAYVISGKTWVNNHAHVLRPLGSPRFLAHWLNTFDYSGLIAGATRSKLNQAKALQIPAPMPPLAEQRRIVSKVDELMALCDQLDAARARREASRDRLAAANLARLNTPDPDTLRNDARLALNALHASLVRSDQIKHLRQTILDLAVRGALVPQSSVKIDIDRLMAKVEAAKCVAHAAEGLRERPPVRTLRRDELSFTFPAAWGLSCFDRLFVIVSGVTKGQSVDKNNAVDVPYLRVANVQRGYLDLSIIKTIAVRRADESRFSLRSGDILMTEGGDWDKLGRAAIWRNESPGCIHQNHVFRVRCASADVLPEWVVMFVNSSLGRSFFADAAKQTTNLASINMTQLRGCPLPIPDPDEQHRIVARVDELMTLCDQLETALTHADTTRRRLLDALLHESLTPALEAAA